MSRVSFVDAIKIARQLGFNGDLKEFWMGMNVEMEHFKVLGGSRLKVGRVVLNHLDERKDYYSFGLKRKFFTRAEVGL